MGWRWSLFSNVIKIIYSHRNIYIFFSRSMCLRMEKSTFTAEIKKTIHPSILTLLKECQRSVLFFHPILRSVDMQSTNNCLFHFFLIFSKKRKRSTFRWTWKFDPNLSPDHGIVFKGATILWVHSSFLFAQVGIQAGSYVSYVICNLTLH